MAVPCADNHARITSFPQDKKDWVEYRKPAKPNDSNITKARRTIALLGGRGFGTTSHSLASAGQTPSLSHVSPTPLPCKGSVGLIAAGRAEGSVGGRGMDEARANTTPHEIQR